MNKLEMSKLSYEEKLRKIKENGCPLRYIENPTVEMCLEAVKENGYALQYVKVPTAEIYLEAVKQNGYALRYIKNPSNELCLEAVRTHGEALQYVKSPTREMCLDAVKGNICALNFVPPKFLKDDLTEIDYSRPLDNFKEEEIPIKLFISTPMRGKTVDEIVKSRFVACIDANRKLGDKLGEVIDNAFPSSSLYTLGKSLELLSTADVAYFSRGWENYRECRVEHQCAVEYGIKIIEG